jgi:hypothetical protein
MESAKDGHNRLKKLQESMSSGEPTQTKSVKRGHSRVKRPRKSV